MINWKDFLYYSKSDRVAIILLLILIGIAGAISIYINHFSSIDLSYYHQEDSVQKEFVEFEKNLHQAQILEEDTTYTETKSIVTKPKKSISKKLEIGQTIDINAASVATLTRIPGVGNTFAERIAQYRTALGGFFELEQLYEIKGITNKKFSQVLPYLQIKKSHQKININTISLEKLSSHPYFNETYIKIISELRKEGKIVSIEQLEKNKNFLAKDIKKIDPYLTF